MQLLRKLALAAIFVPLGGGVGQAADTAKEGNYDITSCWGGNANVISFSKTHSAVSFEIVGTVRSNPPGGFLDMSSFRCVGFTGVIDGKPSGMNFCETIDKDGDKMLVRQIADGPKSILDTLTGTGKFEGIVRTGVTESLGAFPAPKPGMIQGCNRGTGTYKLK